MNPTEKYWQIFDLATQVVTFVLGVWLIVWAATVAGHSVNLTVTGILLLVIVVAQRFLRLKFRQWERPLASPPPPAP